MQTGHSLAMNWKLFFKRRSLSWTQKQQAFLLLHFLLSVAIQLETWLLKRPCTSSASNSLSYGRQKPRTNATGWRAKGETKKNPQQNHEKSPTLDRIKLGIPATRKLQVSVKGHGDLLIFPYGAQVSPSRQRSGGARLSLRPEPDRLPRLKPNKPAPSEGTPSSVTGRFQRTKSAAGPGPGTLATAPRPGARSPTWRRGWRESPTAPCASMSEAAPRTPAPAPPVGAARLTHPSRPTHRD